MQKRVQICEKNALEKLSSITCEKFERILFTKLLS